MIILDTHVWLWWWSKERGRLPARVRKAIETADEIGIAAITCWEVAMLDLRGRIALDRDVRVWIAQSLRAERVRLLQLTPDIAVGAARLLWDNRDPADRLIVATAMIHRAPVVSKDRRIRSFQAANAIW